MPFNEPTKKKDKPSKPEPPKNLRSLSTEDFFDEIIRRVNIVGQAESIVEGAALRLVTRQVLEVRRAAMEDPAFSQHRKYVDGIDVFISEEGYRGGVLEEFEVPALAAELGTTQTPMQPIWRRSARETVSEADRLLKDLVEALARKAESGEAFTEEDLDEVIPMPEIPKDADMPELEDAVDEWDARMAQEE